MSVVPTLIPSHDEVIRRYEAVTDHLSIDLNPDRASPVISMGHESAPIAQRMRAIVFVWIETLKVKEADPADCAYERIELRTTRSFPTVLV